MIPEAAVIAAAKALYADKMSNHSGDNAPQIIDACEKVARKILEDAAPHMLRAARADAWDEGAEYNDDSGMYVRDHNPYRRARG